MFEQLFERERSRGRRVNRGRESLSGPPGW